MHPGAEVRSWLNRGVIRVVTGSNWRLGLGWEGRALKTRPWETRAWQGAGGRRAGEAESWQPGEEGISGRTQPESEVLLQVTWWAWKMPARFTAMAVYVPWPDPSISWVPSRFTDCCLPVSPLRLSVSRCPPCASPFPSLCMLRWSLDHSSS